MTFQADPCEMIAGVILQTLDGPQQMDRHVMYGQRSTGEIGMNVRFPEAGMSTIIQAEKLYTSARKPKMYCKMYFFLFHNALLEFQINH